MSLAAVVYRNSKYVLAPSEEEHLIVEPTSGEVYFSYDYFSKTKLDSDYLMIRLGNLFEIGMLRQNLVESLGESNLLYSKVLYSGSHSGDVIEIELIPALLSEIACVKSSLLALDRDMASFLDSMDLLCQAALDQNNPIVFV